mgnify:CR=1 FL=1
MDESKVDISAINEKIKKESSFIDLLIPEVNKVIIGQKYMIRRLLIALLGKGHILLEGVPGLAKTLAINTLSQAVKGSFSRTENFWSFKRKIPSSFYTGDTGIDPVDDSIKKTIKYGYSHHIERLMVLGNFMLLCEFDPDEVYKWFMELFIDSYDWVMVPNVYGMSQFADGGLMSTKPYISSSNYIFKMSDFKKGDWSKIWDGLFWRFMNNQREFFIKNPRLRMLINTFDKMDNIKRETHLITAEKFLNKIDNE